MSRGRIINRRQFICATAASAGWLACSRSNSWAAGELTTQERIANAVPTLAPVKPRKDRKLLIFGLNVGYGGHPSIATANQAFTMMGQKTGAFEAIISKNPAVFETDSLKRFDAVFFNNTVGNLFTDPRLRKNLVEFVYAGGGLMGVHGTSVAFTDWTAGAKEDWPEFGIMLGARGANHRDSKEHVFIKLDDPDCPINKVFDGRGFEYRDEFFRVHSPYSRERVRVLFSIDTEKTEEKGAARGNCYREDNDYALAWIRNYGRGRVFYCTIAHNPYVFWDTKMLEFYLAATQFALGDLDVSTIPSAKLTPAITAQEKLNWRLGIEAYTFHKYTLFEAIDKTAQLGLTYMGGLSFQKVSKEIDKNFAPGLTDAEIEKLRLKLDSAGVRLLTYYYHEIPTDPAGCKKVFDFARQIGIETFMSEPKLEALDTIEKFCEEYEINLGLHNHGAKMSPQYWNPENIVRICHGRSKRIGACGDMGYWMRAGIDPIKAVRTLKERLITIQVHDLNEISPAGHDVPWGSGAGKTKEFLEEMLKLDITPTMFGLEYSYDWFDSIPEITDSMAFFNEFTLKNSK
jgi:type 1 glutamine amidotransferase/sugar phosphate isomerase/epimerase